LLVALLALTLGNGNGNTHLTLHAAQAAATQSCAHEPHHAGPKPAEHRHPPAHELTCCCDCLGCVSSVAVMPPAAAASAELSAVIRYDRGDLYRAGRAPLPDPDPPRPETPI
jgi:hypothetical protein